MHDSNKIHASFVSMIQRLIALLTPKDSRSNTLHLLKSSTERIPAGKSRQQTDGFQGHLSALTPGNESFGMSYLTKRQS